MLDDKRFYELFIVSTSGVGALTTDLCVWFSDIHHRIVQLAKQASH